MHLRNLRKNPNCTLLMDEDMRLTEGWKGGARAVMLRGTAEIVDDEALLEHYEGKMTDLYLGDEAVRPRVLGFDGLRKALFGCTHPEGQAHMGLHEDRVSRDKDSRMPMTPVGGGLSG